MKLEHPAVQEERGPRKPKMQSFAIRDSSSAFSRVLRNSKSVNFDLNPQHELTAQIFLVAVKQARNNTGFGVLNRLSQNTILSNLWGPLFLLKAAFCTLESVLPSHSATFHYLRDLKLDAVDLETLENILLCRPDLLTDPGQASLAELMRCRALETLIVSQH